MTKAIRIENADTSDHKVIVQVWEKGNNTEPDTLISEHPLDHPTSMLETVIWGNRYLLVKEV